MGTILAYSFTVSLILMFAFSAYRFSHNGSAQIRRTVLLGIYALSLVIIPALMIIDFNKVSVSAVSHETVMPDDLSFVADIPSEVSTFNFGIFLWLYLAGMLFCLLMTVIQLRGVFKILRSSKRQKIDCLTVYVHNYRDIAPFSIGKIVVANDSDISNTMIFVHEKAHIDHLHIIDLCIAQLTCIMCWYCPCAWQMRSELKLVHEFQADESVLDNGTDSRTYCLLLVERAAKMRIISVANGLSYNNLRQRINMIQTTRRNNSRICFLFTLIAVVVGGLLLTVPVIGSTLGQISQISLNDSRSVSNATENKFVLYGVDVEFDHDEGVTVLPKTGAVICSDKKIIDWLIPRMSTYVIDGKTVSGKELSKLPASDIWKVIISGNTIMVFSTKQPEARFFDAVQQAMVEEGNVQ